MCKDTKTWKDKLCALASRRAFPEVWRGERSTSHRSFWDPANSQRAEYVRVIVVSAVVWRESKTHLRGLCVRRALRVLRCVSVCLVRCKYLNFCLFNCTPTVSSHSIFKYFSFFFLFSNQPNEQLLQPREQLKKIRSHMESALVPEHTVW